MTIEPASFTSRLEFVDARIPQLTIRKNEWYDAGDVTLERGTVLWGRVTIQGSNGLPVPDAQVFVREGNAVPTISPTPGREDGIVITADNTGTFRITNAPTGVVNVAAVAPGYARVERQQVSLEPNVENQVMFELPTGVTIAGMVLDSDGDPVEGAKLEARPISNKTAAAGDDRSSSNGQFEIIGEAVAAMPMERFVAIAKKAHN